MDSSALVTFRYWHTFAAMSRVSGHELILRRGEGCGMKDADGLRHLVATAGHPDGMGALLRSRRTEIAALIGEPVIGAGVAIQSRGRLPGGGGAALPRPRRPARRGGRMTRCARRAAARPRTTFPGRRSGPSAGGRDSEFGIPS